MSLTREQFANMVESVAIKPSDTKADMDILISDAKKYHYHIVYVSQIFTDYMIKNLKGTDTLVGGVVGNASGAGEEDLDEKIFMAKHWMEREVKEMDMFMNVPMMRSGDPDYIFKEVKAVREICTGGTLLKVILQTPMLTDDQIREASEMIVKAGADFVKTGSGFFGPTTVDAVKIIKETVGNRARIKAAGGVNGLDMINELADIGVARFGLSNSKAAAIMEELSK